MERAKMSEEFRIERDSMGEMRVPASALYAAQTQRAVENFPISGQRFGRRMIEALGIVKQAAALTNGDLGNLDPKIADAIASAAAEVAFACAIDASATAMFARADSKFD
jgi:fumarate hydratase class II